jgi:hypothetical protein
MTSPEDGQRCQCLLGGHRVLGSVVAEQHPLEPWAARHQHRAGGVVDDLRADRTEDHRGNRAVAATAHDHEINAQGARRIHDLRGRPATQGAAVDAGVLRPKRLSGLLRDLLCRTIVRGPGFLVVCGATDPVSSEYRLGRRHDRDHVQLGVRRPIDAARKLDAELSRGRSIGRNEHLHGAPPSLRAACGT